MFSEPYGPLPCINEDKGIFISRLKSLPYNKRNEDEAIVLKQFDSQELPDRSLCGINSNNTITDKFPWVVALLFKNKETGRDEDIRCSGTIINRRFVLTAARCVTSKKYKPLVYEVLYSYYFY